MNANATVIAVLLLVVAPLQSLLAQRAVPSRSDAGFSGFASHPISTTTVIHGRMDPTDDGATLGYAVVIRGPAGWYNARTRFGDLSPDSLGAGEVGQFWEVGQRRYRFAYDRARETLALFDTIVSVQASRVLLVTLDSTTSGRVHVVLGTPVRFSMAEPGKFDDLFLPLAPEVRAFAGIRP